MRHSCLIRVGPATFRIGCDWPGPVEKLRRMYRAYPAPPSTIPDYTIFLEAVRPWRRYIRPSMAIKADFMLPDAAPVSLNHGLLAAEMAMNLQMALGWRRHLLLHASSVEKDGRALIMTGMSGSGKSTLSAMLGERGWRFMGDEFALLDLADGSVHPFPRPVSLKDGAIAAMEAEVDESRFGPRMLNTPKGDIRHMSPNIVAIEDMQKPARPALLLFPRFGFESAIRPLGKAEIFVRLTQASTNYVAMGETGFAALTRFVEDVPARAIDYRNGEEAISLVDELWSEMAR